MTEALSSEGIGSSEGIDGATRLDAAVDVDVVDDVEGADETDTYGADADDTEDIMVLESVEDPLVLPVWQPTGEPRVDEALEMMALLDADDVHQHAEVFTTIHQQLRDTLSDLDTTV